MRLLREPLVHFMALGVLLFALFRLFGDPADSGSSEIVVTEGHVQRLVEAWKLTWRRPPTQQEMKGLIDDFITEEVLYREAQLLGLDKDDTIIRRRLRQKMELISQELASQLEPTEEELRTYLEENGDYFKLEPVVSFAHVYLNTDRRKSRLPSDAKRLLARLSTAGSELDPASLGDPFPLPHIYESRTQTQVSNIFGAGFADKLLSVGQGKWTGPIDSGYGSHLVKVSELAEGRMPSLDEVRDTVYREWVSTRRREINEDFIGRLREKYTITMVLPEQGEENPLAEKVPR